MQWILAIVFGLVAAAAARDEVLHMAIGGVLGWLLGTVIETQQRLRVLERGAREQARLATLRQDGSEMPESKPSKPEAHPPAKPTLAAAATIHHSVRMKEEAAPAETDSWLEQGLEPAPASATAATPAHDLSQPTDILRSASDAARSIANDIAPNWQNNAVVRWLLKGNLAVKAGVLVSFFGVAFLLKHAVEQGWMSAPIEFRLLVVAAFGGGLIWLGLRLKKSHRIYALSIQGGGIGILYLVTYSALRLYHVLPASTALAILALLAVAAGWLAVTQNARQLAVLGSIGGFLAPLLASTGSGSHVALFSYYLVLNLGIAGVAFHKHWRMLNLLGFIFTFGIGLAWGAKFYQQEYFASVEPFLIAHFLLYTTIAVLSALKQPFRLRGYVDSAIVFGLPLVAFPLQAALVDGESRPLAWSATALAIFYAVLSFVLNRAWSETLRLLTQVFIALAVIFATLAVPLWLDGEWVSNTWALEAAAMIWIGLKQRQSLTHWGGVAILGAAVLTYIVTLEALDTAPLILNSRFMGGAVLCAAFTFSAWAYSREQEFAQQFPFGLLDLRDVPFTWMASTVAAFGWLLLGSVEIVEYAARDWIGAGLLIYFAVLGLAVEWTARRQVPEVRILALGMLPLIVVSAFGWISQYPHPLAMHGWLAWPLAIAALLRAVHLFSRQRALLLTAVVWLVAALLADQTDHVAGLLSSGSDDWRTAAVISAMLGFMYVTRRGLSPIYGEAFRTGFTFGPIIFLLFVGTMAWLVSEPGRFSPLPYLPAVNIMFLLGAVVAFEALCFSRKLMDQRSLLFFAMGTGMLITTFEVARATHHLADVHYQFAYMWRSGIFQAALSMVWSGIGIAGMIFGARQGQRLVWLAGAALMAVVVLKLFGVDLGNTGSVTRIVSFIGVGLLLLVVGYFAPAPTSAEKA